MSYNLIEVQTNGDIAKITLNHSARRNPLSVEMIAELITAFENIGDSEAAGIILAANGPAFCSGHDFKGYGRSGVGANAQVDARLLPDDAVNPHRPPASDCPSAGASVWGRVPIGPDLRFGGDLRASGLSHGGRGWRVVLYHPDGSRHPSGRAQAGLGDAAGW